MRSITGYRSRIWSGRSSTSSATGRSAISACRTSRRELARARAVAKIVSVQNRDNLRDSIIRLSSICAPVPGSPLFPVPAGSRQPRQLKIAARPDRPEPRRHAEPDRAGLAAAAFPRHAANSRDLLDSSSRGESCIGLHPPERAELVPARSLLSSRHCLRCPSPALSGQAMLRAMPELPPREARLVSLQRRDLLMRQTGWRRDFEPSVPRQ